MATKKQKTALVLALCGLMCVGTVKGVSAYLTDAENTTNTFTVGKVQIDTEEKHWPGNDSDKVLNVTPGEVLRKDPQAHNTGKNTSVVFASFDIPMEPVVMYGQRAAATGGNEQAAANAKDNIAPTFQELLTTMKAGEFNADTGKYTLVYKDTDNASANAADGSHVNTDWLKIKKVWVKKDLTQTITVGKDKKGNDLKDHPETVYSTYDDMVAANPVASYNPNNADIYARYLYGYSKTLGAGVTTPSVFDGIRLNNVCDGYVDSSVAKMDVTMYAIQANNITGQNGSKLFEVKEGDAAAGQGIAQRDLAAIYQTYIKQNGEWAEAPDADNNNQTKLNGSDRSAAEINDQVLNLSIDESVSDTSLRFGESATVTVSLDTTLAEKGVTVKVYKADGRTEAPAGEITLTQVRDYEYKITAGTTAGTYKVVASSTAANKSGKHATATVAVVVSNDTARKVND